MIVFNLRSFDHLVPHADEDIDHFIQRDIHRMQRARAALRTGQRYVDRFCCEALLLFPLLQLGGALIQRFLQRRAHFVDQLTYPRALLGGQFSHAAQKTGQFAFFAKNAYANLFKLAARLGFAQLGKYAFADFLQTLLHHDPVLSFNFFFVSAVTQ